MFCVSQAWLLVEALVCCVVYGISVVDTDCTELTDKAMSQNVRLLGCLVLCGVRYICGGYRLYRVDR